MRGKFLDDSYDIVKRFRAECLAPIAKLYAHPLFVPADISDEYTALTAIRTLEPDEPPRGSFGLLIDPDTGVPINVEARYGATTSHASPSFIIDMNENLRPFYMICFDQSYHRSRELNRVNQMERKREFLRQMGVNSFYYDSHASFLFMSGKAKNLAAVRRRLVSLGVPDRHFIP